MATIKIATFNANNLYIRYKFAEGYPGSQTIENLDERKGYLPIYSRGSYEMFNDLQREIAAKAITGNGTSYPDILCLQEIESMIALRVFNDNFLNGHYKHSLVIDSYDFRQIDVALLTNLDILNIKTNVDIIDSEWEGIDNLDYQKKYLFSRDCLEVELKTSNTNSITLFINHFKSKFPGIPPAGTPDREEWIRQKKIESDNKRLRQTTEVLNIIRNRFTGDLFNTKDFIVLGDFNEYPDAAPIAPLLVESQLENIFLRIPKPEERWTHYWKSERIVAQLDHILVSPSISGKTDGILPYIERKAIGFKDKSSVSGYLPRKVKLEFMDNDPNPTELDFQFERFEGITDKISASDHCPVFFEIPV